MVSTRKKKQSNRRLFSQLDDFDQDVKIGDVANNGQQNVIIRDGTVDREFTAINSGSNSMANANTVNVQTLERSFNERIDNEMGNIVDTVEDRIQNTVLAAIDSNITPRIELAVISKMRHLDQMLLVSRIFGTRNAGNA